MKYFLILTGLLALSAPAIAMMQNLSPESLDMATVLSANSRDFAELSTFGNKITNATMERTSGEYTRFEITIEQCQLSGCFGGGKLIIERIRDLTPGHFPPYRYFTKLVRFR